jgi:hypothetical protein
MQDSATQSQSKEVLILNQLVHIGGNMTGWLKFLGIILIIMGAFVALSLVGIIIAWLPIWLGVLLLQAGNRGSTANMTKNPAELIPMMDKLRLFFIIYGVLTIVYIALVILGIIFFGTFFSTFMESIPDMNAF